MKEIILILCGFSSIYLLFNGFLLSLGIVLTGEKRLEKLTKITFVLTLVVFVAFILCSRM